MNNIINILFLCAHYAVYIYVARVIYKKFVRPYLLHEQRQQRALMVQLQQKLSNVQELMGIFRQQVDYLTTLFKKISQQQQQAHELNEKLAHEQAQLQARIQAEYEQQQHIIAHNRHVKELYQALAPEVMQELHSELMRYSQNNGKQYLDGAIKALKEQSKIKSNV
jgi:DNA anti-recombination protein RmuC